MTSVTIPPENRRAPRPWCTGTLGGIASRLDGATIITVAFAAILFQQQLHLSPAAVGALAAEAPAR